MDAPLPLTALGVPVDLVCTGSQAAAARAALAERWSLCDREAREPATRRVEVAFGPELSQEPEPGIEEPRVVGTDLAALLVAVTHHVTWQAVDANVGSLLMFHAAGLANPVTGAAVVCIAPGGTGKTTLCRTLGPGRGYLSDETVGIDAEGRLVAYRKPLSLRSGDHPPGAPKDEVAPQRHGLAPSEAPARAEGILLLERLDDGPDEPEVSPLDLFDAIIAATPETSSLARLPRPLHRLADVLGSASLLARVRYREAGSLEPLLARLIGPPLAAEAAR